MRLMSFIVCFIAAIGASALDLVHLVDAPIETLTYHYRIQLKNSAETQFGIKWNLTDSDNFRYVKVESFGAAGEDPWGDCLNIAIGWVANGVDSVCFKETLVGSFDLHRLGFSLRLDVGENGGILSIGSKQIEKTYKIDFDNSMISKVVAWSNRDVKVLRDDFRLATLHIAEYADFDSVDSLTAYLEDSKDPYEGAWTYFDRNTDALRSQMGGKYTLATVKTAEGYDILYLSGATVNGHDWQPLRIKGRLTAATFAGAFDLIWFEPNGRIIDYETSATIEGDLLTTRFPHWKSIVRFRRIKLNEISR